MTSMLTQSPAWLALQEHNKKMRAARLIHLFADDNDRTSRYTKEIGGLSVDFSRNHITDETLTLLIQLAEQQNLTDWRDSMFKGEKINNTEDCAVLHTALRSSLQNPILVDGHDVIPDIQELHKHMEKFVEDVRGGKWLGATGQTIKHIVNIGIGGSYLGPRFVCKALCDYSSKIKTHFVANADYADIKDILEQLDPASVLFVVVSKTFTTAETLLNAHTARKWLTEKLGEEAISRHFVAVSTNHEAVKEFGISLENTFAMWNWIGGRYSLWSSVGLTIALSIGWNNFKELLGGAEAIDEHFKTAPLAKNIPVLLGLIGLWYRNFWGTACHAILPYSERLQEMPRFLQQLEMESNGKSVSRDGEILDYRTSPAIFGECGTIGQHSFHQWLHQGTDIVPSDFIGIKHDGFNKPEHHSVLMANLMAQSEALMQGRLESEACKTNSGNKPSTIILLEKLDPRRLGMLLAIYEHKVFVQGIMWEINSFDQFGVELGKILANEALKK